MHFWFKSGRKPRTSPGLAISAVIYSSVLQDWIGSVQILCMSAASSSSSLSHSTADTHTISRLKIPKNFSSDYFRKNIIFFIILVFDAYIKVKTTNYATYEMFGNKIFRKGKQKQNLKTKP